ncbi:MAG: N-acetyl-alpha-D-glucosaminyl L-malate synthase BshA [bacterium]|nr:N-acetyl-alpha-D-glucosaminyl L-malate synthase BshA [bacterium]
MRMPRIGITCYPDQGGSGVVATELGLHLARHGCEVHFITSSLPFRLRAYGDNIFFHKVEMPEYPVFKNSPYTLSLATAMQDVALKCKLDILHVHYAIPHAAAAFLAREMMKPRDLKIITTLHGTDITLVGKEPSFFPMTQFLIKASDAVTAVSNFLKSETERVFGVGENIKVIPNFVDPRIFKPAVDKELKESLAPDQEKIILHASNFREVKNLPAVINVFEKVCQTHKARLVLVGDGPEAKAVQARVQEIGLRPLVSFLGQVDQLEKVLPVADFLLLPSLHESFGLVALEAMACSVVPVITNVGGASEFINDGLNGFLRAPDDVQGMAQVITRLIDDENGRQMIAEEARRDAVMDFGASCVMRQYLELYETII